MGLVNMKKEQGRKDKLEEHAKDLIDEVYLEPKIDFAREDKNKTTVKMMPANKIKENPNAKRDPLTGTTTEEVADLRKAINSIKPKTQNARIHAPVQPKRPMKPKPL
jgi:hypothetical protein